MMLGTKVIIHRHLQKKPQKYFDMDEYFKYECEDDKSKFGEYDNLFSYEEHEKLIEEDNKITKELYTEAYKEEKGIIVGKRFIGTKRQFEYFPEYGDGWTSYDAHIECNAIFETIYLVAVSMNCIRKVRITDMKEIKE